MATVTDNNLRYGLNAGELAVQAVAEGRGRYVATVAMRISAFVLLPAMFWGGIAAIIL